MFEKKMWLKNHRINENNIIERRCSSCNEWLEENYDNYYYKNKKKPELGFSPECKRCAIKRSIEHREENNEKYLAYFKERYHNDPEKFIDLDRQNRLKKPEQYKEKDRIWRQRNPEKCRWHASLHRIHDITPSEERALLEVFNHQCAYCGMTEEESKIKYGQKLHNDHVDEDGYNDLRNDVPACKGCNCSKHEFELEDWYPKQKFFDENKYNKIIWWITEGYKEYIENKKPYRIIKRKNQDINTFHWELWSVDEMRNMLSCIQIANKKKELHI